MTIDSNYAPNSDALLELKQNHNGSSTKGLLLPRLGLTSTTAYAPMSAHIQGMTVYNTDSINDVMPGYYYNDGTKWIKLFPEASSVIPKFFYMPSIVLPTDTSDSSYDFTTQTFTVDL